MIRQKRTVRSVKDRHGQCVSIACASIKVDPVAIVHRLIDRGVPVKGLYPPDEETLARYKAETGG